MINPIRWSIAERHMVRYHLSRLMWSGLGGMSLLLLLAIAIVAANATNALGSGPASTAMWSVALVVAPLLTGVSFITKESMVRRFSAESSLYQLVRGYRRTVLATQAICLLAGVVPCVIAMFNGGLLYPLLIVVVPLAAMFVHFPHTEKFYLVVEEVLQTGA